MTGTAYVRKVKADGNPVSSLEVAKSRWPGLMDDPHGNGFKLAMPVETLDEWERELQQAWLDQEDAYLTLRWNYGRLH